MRRAISTSIIISVLLLNVHSTFAQLAGVNDDGRLNIQVPYSLVQSWAANARFKFPKYTANFSKQNNLVLQYYLQSRTYNVKPTGVFDTKTAEALSAHQNGDSEQLTFETVENINKFYSYLYCPVGLTSADNVDFRLENVNKKRILPPYYIPNNLVIEEKDEYPSTNPICLERETFDAFKAMYDAAQEDGIDLFVTSSYRGEDSQDYLLHVMIKRMGNAAYRIVAEPGKSEHNLGTSLDFAAMEGGKRIPLTASKQIVWLEKNAPNFGFVNSYPIGKEAITGFHAEPWHWRYVGIPIAATVDEKGITLAEFFTKYKVSLQRRAVEYGGSMQSWLREVVIGG